MTEFDLQAQLNKYHSMNNKVKINAFRSIKLYICKSARDSYLISKIKRKKKKENIIIFFVLTWSKYGSIF